MRAVESEYKNLQEKGTLKKVTFEVVAAVSVESFIHFLGIGCCISSCWNFRPLKDKASTKLDLKKKQ